MTDDHANLSLRQQYLGWRHGCANLGWLIAMHGGLLGWLWWGRLFVPYPAFLLLAVAVCLLHQRLLSEWFHEATHWNLVPARGWNDGLADLLIGPWNGTRVASNRVGHFRHHASAAYFQPDDPDTRQSAAGTRRELRAGLLRDVTGRSALGAFVQAAGHGTRVLTATLAWLAVLALLHLAGVLMTFEYGRADIYPLYFGTLLTLYPVANRMRLYAQHASLPASGRAVITGSSVARDCDAGLLEQVLLHSPMIMYHGTHHERPALPYRALRAAVRAQRRAGAAVVHGNGGLRLVRAVLRGLPA